MDMAGHCIDSAEAARRLFDAITRHPREIAAFAYLDRDRRLLGLRHSPSTERDTIAVPVRRVAADALAFDAAALVMAHNHPSGDPTPSGADIAVTRTLHDALAAIDVRLIDHLILTPDRIVSFRAIGLL